MLTAGTHRHERPFRRCRFTVFTVSPTAVPADYRFIGLQHSAGVVIIADADRPENTIDFVNFITAVLPADNTAVRSQSAGMVIAELSDSNETVGGLASSSYLAPQQTTAPFFRTPQAKRSPAAMA